MKSLPSLIDLEKNTLGYAMLDPSALDTMRGFLDQDDFSLEKHKRIWRCLTFLYDAGKPIDRITVYQELAARGEADSVGGIGYLVECDDGLPQLPEISGYLERLRESTLRRKVILAAEHIALRAADESDPIHDVLQAMGSMLTEVTQSSLKNSGPVSTREMIASEGLDKLLSPRQHGGVRLPWTRLDDALSGLSGGQLIVLMAATSRGKSAMALQIATSTALQGGTPVIWTLEMSRRSLFQRAVTQLSGVQSTKYRMTFDERDAVKMASIKIDEYAVYLDSDARNVGGFVAGLRRVRAKAGLSLAVVDHLQLIRGSSSRNRSQEVSDNSRAIKLAAMDLDIPIVLLSQVDRASVKGDGEIGLHSAKESGDVENDGDVVMWIKSAELSRDADTPVSLHIGKQREGPAGFSIPMVFRPSSQSFMETGE